MAQSSANHSLYQEQNLMNPKYAPLFQTYTLNNGVTIKNRLAVAPMTHFGSQAKPFTANLKPQANTASTA